jgi:hypothetical protein
MLYAIDLAIADEMSSRSNLHDHYSWDELVTRALKSYKKGRYDEALEALNSVCDGNFWYSTVSNTIFRPKKVDREAQTQRFLISKQLRLLDSRSLSWL